MRIEQPSRISISAVTERSSRRNGLRRTRIISGIEAATVEILSEFPLEPDD